MDPAGRQSMKRALWCFIAVMASSPLMDAATINVPSMSRTDMVNALNSASDGDVLVFPAGTANYSSSVSITKGVVMQFAGAGQSVIANTSGSATTFVLS